MCDHFKSLSEGVQFEWKFGIDYEVPQEKDAKGNIMYGDVNFYGPGKFYPGEPGCKFHGKGIPCLTYVSKSGGISVDILVDVFRKLDEIKVYERVEGGPIPFLHIDGHQNRLSPQFIKYINSEDHR